MNPMDMETQTTVWGLTVGVGAGRWGGGEGGEGGQGRGEQWGKIGTTVIEQK